MTVYLDGIDPLHASVAYGNLGRRGDLGYENKRVAVLRRRYERALSTHAPARVAFNLDGNWSTFRCHVAINDDVPHGRARASFSVLADGRQVAHVANVAAGDAPREIIANIDGATTLELAVDVPHRDFAHTVWLEPRLDESAYTPPQKLVDCLERAEVEFVPMTGGERCIATVVSAGFEALLDDMLGSLFANGGCPDASVVVFIVGDSPQCERIVAKYGATAVRCRPLRSVRTSIKSILYSIAHIVDARQYLCIDADTLIVSELTPLFGALDALPSKSILVCRESNHERFIDLERIYAEAYGGKTEEMGLFMTPQESKYRLVVNDGVFAGSREAMLDLDACIRAMPHAIRWHDAPEPVAPWRNQFFFNVAIARLDAGVPLDDVWNVQMHSTPIEFEGTTPKWSGGKPRIIHLSGWPKVRFPHVQGSYARVERPLVAPAPGDGYAEFLRALRGWIGKFGADALRWSFYGTAADDSVQVRDASTFPLFATLHYLIRSNGCIRVVESGTARGVSAACIASAIAHRNGARVVTFDPNVFPERDALWRALPEKMRACIEPRRGDSIAGMRAALASGERYHAALLDSVHTEEHVWAEFEVARQLVCRGGLILIHDATLPHATVAGALKRIEDAGYGVARLWTAEEGSPEDDRLGLAIVENRTRA